MEISDPDIALEAAQNESERLKHEKINLQSSLDVLQHEKAELQSTVSTLIAEAADTESRISTLKTALEIAQHEVECTNSILVTKEVEVAKANSQVSTLLADLETARDDAKSMKSSLDALHALTIKENQKRMPGISAFKQWVSNYSISGDDHSSSSSDQHNILSHKALLGIRSDSWNSAYEDAKQSIDILPSAMGYITKSLAQVGMGDIEEAMQVFDLVFGNCNPNESNLLLLIKTIVVFLAGRCDDAISRVQHLIAVARDDETMYCHIQVLGKMYLIQGDYERAVNSLKQAPPSSVTPELEAISLIFAWDFDGLWIAAQRYHCEALLAASRAEDATQALIKILETFNEGIQANGVTAEWVTDLRKKCVDLMEALGDTALDSGEHVEAIARYSSALFLSPPNAIDLLTKRSKARAAEGLWEDSLTDANKVIELDPSSYRGYERKHAALHGLEHYGEAINTALRMLSIIENSPDEEIRRLKEDYTPPVETIAAIDKAVHEIFKLCPLVLIDVTTGRLCDAHERVRIFKLEATFKKIVSEATVTKIDDAHIFKAVAKYFEWVMFSHTWAGKEPTFQDVNLVESIWQLDAESPLHEKLRQFCTTTRDDGHRWAWSDTCCINKDTEAVLNRSLTSMYSWYEEAAATLVYLADVLSVSELGDLTNSRWMSRAWTLQELLASKVVRFYNREWKLYLNDMHTNHKESSVIKEELARAMRVAPETIASFRPQDLGVREKLRLASTRHARVEEDVAYSLIGIFSSDIAPRYGVGKAALGQLLENIVARSGDVTVIAWTGKPSPYNSALPASLAVYGQDPYSPPSVETSEFETEVEQLRARLKPEHALPFYFRVIHLPRATFSNRCLQLPCVVFLVTKVGVQELDPNEGNLYRASVSLLGKVVFRTADTMPLSKPKNLVFVHPWLHDLRDPLDEFVDDEAEVESDAGSEAESAMGSGDSAHHHSPPASHVRAEPAVRVNSYTKALQLFVNLKRPFNALLLERQPNGQYKRVAAEREIIVAGVPCQTNPKDIRAKVLEIV